MSHLPAKAILFCLLLSTAAQPSDAIIRRHDVPDAKYLAFGQAFRDSVGMLSIPRTKGTARGTGTLIARDWVLTAAHVVDGYVPGEKKATFKVGDRILEVAEIITHPKAGPSAAGEDIALVRLATPAPSKGIPCLYGGKGEKGKVVTLAGIGFPGDGQTGPIRGAELVLRAATVRVDIAEANIVAWYFHGPQDPKTTPMEGISGPADSGGPALLKIGGKWCHAGISSTQDDPKKVGEGRYGVLEYYARVSHHKRWLESVMRSRRR
jgi:secreted trypsin-like serine protease